jgi:hypothetical protein
MLLTNVPTTSLEEALERARWYASRWGIEVFLRTLKTGCQLEERQLGYAVWLENCLAIDLVVAWRIYHLTMLGRLDPQAPCTVFFRDPKVEGAVQLVSRRHPDPCDTAHAALLPRAGSPSRATSRAANPTATPAPR